MNTADAATTLALTFGASLAHTLLSRCPSGEDEINLIEATDMVTMGHRDWSDLGDALAAKGLGAEWASRQAELTLVASRATLAALAAA